jgi:hypothetical protein
MAARLLYSCSQSGTPERAPEGRMTTMTTLRTRLMMAAAVLAVAAGSASAQSYKAEIPVAFRAGETQMAAGSYQITVMGQGSHYVKVLNSESGKSALLIPISGQDTPKVWRDAGKPVLAFECVAEHCKLSKMWNGTDSFSYRFYGPNLPNGEARSALVVKLTTGD